MYSLRIDDFNLSWLTKLPFSTGYLKDVKNIRILSHGYICVESRFSMKEQNIREEYEKIFFIILYQN